MSKSIGPVLRKARLDAGLSQRDLSKASGLTLGQVSQLESDARKAPTFASVARIAAATGVSLDALAHECGLISKTSKVKPIRENVRLKKSLTDARVHTAALLAEIDASLSAMSDSGPKRKR